MSAGMIMLLAAISASAIIHITKPLDDGFYMVSDIVVIVFSLSAFVMGLYAYRLYGIRSVQGKALLMLALGNMFWFFGELIWGIIEITTQEGAPILSVADTAWLAGYPIFIAGIYYSFRVAGKGISENKKILAVLVSVIIISIVTIWGIIPTLSGPGMEPLELSVTAGYVVGDLILFVLLINLIISFSGGKFARPWYFIAAGIMLTVIADMVYFYMAGLYQSGSMIDMLWEVDYLLTAFGFFYYRESMENMLKAGTTHKTEKNIDKTKKQHKT